MPDVLEPPPEAPRRVPRRPFTLRLSESGKAQIDVLAAKHHLDAATVMRVALQVALAHARDFESALTAVEKARWSQ